MRVGGTGRHKDRNMKDRKMKKNPIFLSFIFLSTCPVSLRLCRAANLCASALKGELADSDFGLRISGSAGLRSWRLNQLTFLG